MILYLLSVLFFLTLNTFREQIILRRAKTLARLFCIKLKRSLPSLFPALFFTFLIILQGRLCAQIDEGGLPATKEVSEPTEYRTDDYRSPVPRTLKGAKVISSNEAEKLIGNRLNIFIDVFPRAPKPDNLPDGTLWRETGHSTIEGAYWLPNVGYGVLSPDLETYFKTRLEILSNHQKNCTIVFLCMRDCWMSWNAAKRAISLGYTSVHWFPEGTDGWMMLGNSLVDVDPVP